MDATSTSWSSLCPSLTTCSLRFRRVAATYDRSAAACHLQDDSPTRSSIRVQYQRWLSPLVQAQVVTMVPLAEPPPWTSRQSPEHEETNR